MLFFGRMIFRQMVLGSKKDILWRIFSQRKGRVPPLLNGKSFCQKKHRLMETRTNCSRKVHEIEPGSQGRLLRWREWRVIICKRPDPLNNHFQVAGSFRWSFAGGKSLQVIICKWPDSTVDHLQGAKSFGWPFAYCQILRMINCMRPDSSRWSFATTKTPTNTTTN